MDTCLFGPLATAVGSHFYRHVLKSVLSNVFGIQHLINHVFSIGTVLHAVNVAKWICMIEQEANMCSLFY